MKIKLMVGPKKRHLYVPEGWKIITDIPMEKNDLAANLYTARWEPIEDDDIGLIPWQDYVIRKIEE